MMLETLPTLDRDALFARLSAASDDTLVLCVSARVAQHLQAAFARWQSDRGQGVWRSPEMTTPDVFLAQLDECDRLRRRVRGESLATPLSAAEVDVLWRLVVAEPRESIELLREADAASRAAEAWRLCHDYGVSIPLPATSPEAEYFNRWAQQYRDRCSRLGRPDPSLHRNQLIGALRGGTVQLPARIALAGFDRIAPWVQDLLSVLRARGCELQTLMPPPAQGERHARAAESAEQELRAAATWVRERAIANPEARIAVVVPDLGQRRADVLRVFDEVLCPQQSAAAERPYNISLGEPLMSVGLIQNALLLLRLSVSRLEWPAASALLCAPYWDDADAHADARADLDRLLRRDGHLQVSLNLLLQQSRRHSGLSSRFERMAAVRALRGTASPGDWSERFTTWLDAAGWPGARPLNSEEYQALQAWRELLRDLGKLGAVLGNVAASGALEQLTQLAQRRVFQPKTPTVGIQLLGALEAQGLHFEALWVLGLDDERWPPAGDPNPFIPFALQRQAGMPHASAAHDLAWAERMTAGWRVAADEVVFSWPQVDADRQLAPSPLIHVEAAGVTICTEATRPQSWMAAAATGRDERIADAYAPQPDLQRPLAGGARLLGDQARCPFRAVATHRLGAQPLEQPGYGPSAIDRGQLVHRTLERLWRGWRDQATLLALDEEALDVSIAAAVDHELERLSQEAPHRFTPALRVLEASRLQALFGRWLRMERERPAFVVDQLEGGAPEGQGETQELHFGGLLLRLRPDRIDRLASGERLVLDYKTGAKRPPPWHDGRPEEPQLLLYGLTQPDIGGLAYARLTAGEAVFDGIGTDDSIAPGVRAYADVRDTRDAASWDALMGRWRGELETLAAEVRRGLASVTPKHVRQTCRDCHLHAACRIREHVVSSAAVAGGEDGDGA